MSVSRQPGFAPLKKQLCLLVFISSALCGSGLSALTLGEQKVFSFLGDPIEVEIEVLEWDDTDLDAVLISVAGAAEYEAFNLNYLPVLQDLNFNLVGPNSNGEVKVLVSTREPALEPYIELLLLLRWPGGSLQREYVLLFDLPLPVNPPPVPVSGIAAEPVSEPAETGLIETETAVAAGPADSGTSAEAGNAEAEVVVVAADSLPDKPQAASVRAPSEANPDTLAETQAPQAEPAGEQNAMVEPAASVEAVVMQAAESEPQTSSGARSGYRVKTGDILWNIGQQFLPADSAGNIYQILLSLHEINPAAFINGNISLLKADAVLQIPTAAELGNIDPASAKAVFEQRWNEGSRRREQVRSGQDLPAFTALATTTPAEEFIPEVPLPDPDYAADALEQGKDLLLPEPAAGDAAQEASSEALSVSEIEQTAPDAGLTRPDQIAAESISAESISAESIAAEGIPAESIAPESTTPESTAEVSDNPYLERVSASSRQALSLLESRAMRVAQLEQQLNEMRVRMEAARKEAASLNAILEQALLNRARRDSVNLRNTVILGALVLILVVALLMSAALMLKLGREVSRQRSLLASDPVNSDEIGDGAAPAAVPARPVVPATSVPAMEVIELDPEVALLTPDFANAAGLQLETPDLAGATGPGQESDAGKA